MRSFWYEGENGEGFELDEEVRSFWLLPYSLVFFPGSGRLLRGVVDAL